uniref:Uncharacterized protein n=1 Tax=Cacopsylla melanoneura TaxID=428564 RepID=A0A8D9AJE7_9HEMI
MEGGGYSPLYQTIGFYFRDKRHDLSCFAIRRGRWSRDITSLPGQFSQCVYPLFTSVMHKVLYQSIQLGQLLFQRFLILGQLFHLFVLFSGLLLQQVALFLIQSRVLAYRLCLQLQLRYQMFQSLFFIRKFCQFSHRHFELFFQRSQCILIYRRRRVNVS